MKKLNKNSLLVIMTILLACVCMIISFPKLQENAENYIAVYNTREQTDRMLDEAYQSTLPLYYKNEKQNRPDLKPYELFVNEKDQELSVQLRQEITDAIAEDTQSLETNFTSMDYLIRNNVSNTSLTRGDKEELENLLNIQPTSHYAWYIVFTFDENGVFTITDYSEEASPSYLSGRYQSKLLSTFGSTSLRLHTDSSSDELVVYYEALNESFDFIGIKNTTFVFGMDNAAVAALSQGDSFNSTEFIAYNEAAFGQIMLISGVLIILLLILRIKQEEVVFFKLFEKIPLEIHLCIASLWCAFISELGMSIKYTLAGEHFMFLSGSAETFWGYLFLYGVENMIWWIFIFGYAAYLTLYIKYLWKTKTWTKHCLILRLVAKIKRAWKRGLYYIEHFDMSNEDDKRIMIVLAINFMIMMILIFMWGFGIFFLVIYTIVLYIIAKKYIRQVRNDYHTLLSVTKKLAEGDLESDTNVDMGIFNPFKEEMADIRDGFKKAVDEEVHSQRMKTELITNVSHDLKTPLTSIITYVDLLKKEGISKEDATKYIDTIDRNSQRLKHLIDDLFEISKANSGNVTMEPMQMDICALMKQVQFELEERLTQKHLQIRNTFSDEKILCYLDPQKTYRIFENLVSNISKYAMPSTRVYVDITDYGNQVELVLRNISANELNFNPDDITERFTRGDASRNTEGSGLGLAIAKSFTELQNGSLKVHTDGDLFKVTLRFYKEEDVENT